MIDPKTIPDDHLLRLFLADVANRLREKAQQAVLAACSDEIEETVRASIESLRPQLQTFYDMQKGSTIVQLSIRLP